MIEAIASSIRISLPRSTYKPPDLSLLIRRVLAFLVDWMIGLRLFEVLIQLFFRSVTGSGLADAGAYDLDFHIQRELATMMYFLGSWIAPWRATLGMLLFRLQVVNLAGTTLAIGPALWRYFLFSLWLLYFNRRYFVFIMGIDLGFYTLEEAQNIVYAYNDWFTSIKVFLLLVLFLIPYSYLGGRTLPDYLSGARVIHKNKATAA
ncbi:MAG: RDD family protein [Rickettsiales bacterium]